MDFQRYNDGVGLVAQNKFQSAIPTCPLCSERVDWEIAFDFSGNLICILAMSQLRWRNQNYFRLYQ